MNWPHPTIRLRLTLLYGGLFIAASALLLALTYGLLGQALQPLDRPDPDEVENDSGDQEGGMKAPSRSSSSRLATRSAREPSALSSRNPWWRW